MNRAIRIVVFSLFIAEWTIAAQSDINEVLGKLDLNTAGLNEIIQLFGEPQQFVWGNEKLQKSSLPATYLAVYPNGLQFLLADGKIREIRHEGPTGFRFKDKLEVGSSLETALDVLGGPAQTVSGQTNAWADGVLYRDIDGRKGHCYYQRAEQNIRVFFAEYKVAALYITNTAVQPVSTFSRVVAVTPAAKADSYDDVRFKDLSRIDTLDSSLVQTLTYNEATVWPQHTDGSDRIDRFADRVLRAAMNPGLGVRQLHKQGITGKGVNVGIIDQPLCQDHPEFAGKIAAYFDAGCGTENSSMHGPAVASLLAGERCGTAPGARLYYVAAPSWTKDTLYQARALEWIIEQNSQLPAGQKIRIVSVSAKPSGPGSPFEKNQSMWDDTCRKAEVEGILVLDCTDHHGFIAPAHFLNTAAENPSLCRPGFPEHSFEGPYDDRVIYVPTCPRTTAEEYQQGNCAYAYWGQGGLSWAIPYAAGVLAMGWQVWPEATGEQMKSLLFQSAHTDNKGAKIINPVRFINEVTKAQKARTL